MSMTYEKFVGYALNLKDLSDSIDDGWNICEHLNPMNGNIIKYMVKKKMEKFNEYAYHEFPIEKNYQPITCEYHVLYNPSYSCPDMFYNMWSTDGKLLSLEHIWSQVHRFSQHNLVLDKWNAITQEEHPFNNRPFFRVHPCQNTHIMEILNFSKTNLKFNPLITWLSTISPFIGLEVHTSYGLQNSLT